MSFWRFVVITCLLNMLNTARIPSVDVLKETFDVEYGQRISLLCNVTSIPFHYIVYLQKISVGTAKNITGNTTGIDGVTIPSPSLTILNAELADSGLYRCIAVNIVGTGLSQNVSLTVIGGLPKVEVTSVRQILEYGQPITLECNITSFPSQRSVYWQRQVNSTTTNITSDYPGISEITTNIPSMTILKVVSADAGQYTCNAINIFGVGSSNCVLISIVEVERGKVETKSSASSDSHSTITLAAAIPSLILAICAVITVVITIKVYRYKRKRDYINQNSQNGNMGEAPRTSNINIVAPEDIQLQMNGTVLWNGHLLVRREKHLKAMLQSYKGQNHDVPVSQLARLERNKPLEHYSLATLRGEFKKLTGKNLDDYLSFGNKGNTLECAQQLIHWTIIYANKYGSNENTIPVEHH